MQAVGDLPDNRVRSGAPGHRRGHGQGPGQRKCLPADRRFDTHASQDTLSDNGAYVRLMVTLNAGLKAFYDNFKNTGLLGDTLLLSFSEFGRRITENGGGGRSRRAASPRWHGRARPWRVYGRLRP